jgi:uncharacterized protein
MLRRSWLKAVLLIIALGYLLLSLTTPALAVPIQSVPNPRQVNGGWVTDLADLLPPSIEAALNQKISALESLNGTEIAVVTVPDTTPSATPKQFASELFQAWGIGKKGLNNGILLLISKNDRRVEIQTGTGIEPLIPNTEVSRIIQFYILPNFKKGEFSAGVVAGTQTLIHELTQKTSLQQRLVGWFRENPEVIAFGVLLTLFSIPFSFSVWKDINKALNPMQQWVHPVGKSHISISQRERLNCIICKQLMEKLDAASTQSYLSDIQKEAQMMGNIRVDAWHCAQCQPELNASGLHLRTYILKPDLPLCPSCEEYTVEQTSEVLEPATRSKAGQCRVIQECHYCDYRSEEEKIIPAKTFNTDGSSDDGGPSSGSIGGSGGFGGDSGGFGGGSSDGGGAGGSW